MRNLSFGVTSSPARKEVIDRGEAPSSTSGLAEVRLCAFVAWQAKRTHEHAACSVRFEKKSFTYMVGGVVHHAEMMCRDPAEVLQEKLLDLEHNPAECMWWKHEVASNAPTRRALGLLPP